ncbi:MAG TPA: c-type cytochrome biogenesis protein CcsB [bacterium]|nr:c-type cytochrome biogenesis protein CcsB [bacterium]
MNVDVLLTRIAIAVYVTAGAMSLFRLTGRSGRMIPVIRGVMAFGWLMHTVAFLARWRATYATGYGHVPVTNRYESLVFFGWCLALAWLVLAPKWPAAGTAAGMQLGAAVMTAAAGLLPGSSPEIEPLMPALRSNWLLFHVVTCFLAYAAFAAATFVAIRVLIRNQAVPGEKSPNFDADSFMHRMISVGFFLLTLGILSGSAWAQQSWGRYWGWDPKEVWSLITWIIYAIFLHARISRGWTGKRLALVAIAGFLAVLITYLGVNYLPLLQGLHSYA